MKQSSFFLYKIEILFLSNLNIYVFEVFFLKLESRPLPNTLLYQECLVVEMVSIKLKMESSVSNRIANPHLASIPFLLPSDLQP